MPSIVFPTVGIGMGGYSLTNMGWDMPSMTDIDVSLWALLSTGLSKIDSRRIGYLQKGAGASVNNIKAPFQSGKYVLCLSYTYDSHRVEVIRYFTNEPDPSFPMQITLRQFRDPKFEIDGSGELCNSLATSVGDLPRPAPIQRPSRACLTVNGRQVCG